MKPINEFTEQDGILIETKQESQSNSGNKKNSGGEWD
jgi:hypothetical protein